MKKITKDLLENLISEEISKYYEDGPPSEASEYDNIEVANAMERLNMGTFDEYVASHIDRYPEAKELIEELLGLLSRMPSQMMVRVIREIYQMLTKTPSEETEIEEVPSEEILPSNEPNI